MDQAEADRQGVVSVIVRTNNDRSVLRETLEAVFSQKMGRAAEYLLVDEGSSDGTLQVADGFPFNHRILLGRFVSGSHTLNRAMEMAKGELVIHLLGHTIPVGTGCFQALLDSFKEDSVAAVYGRQRPHPRGDLFKNIDFEDGYNDIRRESNIVSHSFVALRRSVWQEVPYDEGCLSAEDKPWSQEVRRRQRRFIYEPEARVLHYHRFSLGVPFRRAYTRARTHRQIRLSYRALYFAVPFRVLNDFRKIERKIWLPMSPIYRGVEAIGYLLGWYFS